MWFERSKQQDPIVGSQVADSRYYVRDIVLFYDTSRNRRDGLPHPGKKETQVVIDLRHAAYCGAGSAGDDLLLDGNCRTESFNIVYIGFVHTGHELASIGAETFRVTPLTFGKEGIDRQGRFTRARYPSDHYQLIAGNGNINIF